MKYNEWKEASEVFGFEIEQYCAKGYEIKGMKVHYNINDAIIGKDIVCTDSLQASMLESFDGLRITKDIMKKANPGAVLNPCPPFYRGEEVSDEVINSDYFVGYDFKKCLLHVQQAVILHCLTQ